MADDDNMQYQDNKGELDVPEQPLPQDFGTPSAPPDDVAPDKNITPDFPETDTDLDEHERYDAGTAAASGAEYQHGEQDKDERRIA